jgi:hypothetical protein
VLSGFRQDAEAWPRSARGMGDALRRLAPALRLIGIAVWVGEKHGRDGYACSLRRIANTGDIPCDELPLRSDVHNVHGVHAPDGLDGADGERCERCEHGERHSLKYLRETAVPEDGGTDDMRDSV